MAGTVDQVGYGNWVSKRRITGPLLLGLAVAALGLLWRWSLVIAVPFLAIAAYFALARWRFSSGGGDIQRRIQDLVLDNLDWDGQGRALDIGCGSGSLAIGLARRSLSAEVVGIDTWGAS